MPCTAASSLATEPAVPPDTPMVGTAGSVCLAPTADIWSVPGQGLIGQFETGLTYFPGAVAIGCASLLQGGVWPAGHLFSQLMRDFPPQDVFGCLTQMRDAGLLTDADTQDWAGPLTADDLHHAGLNVLPGHGAGLEPLILLTPLSECAEPMPPQVEAWLPVSSSVEQITVGPIFHGLPSDPCTTCLAARAAEHDDFGRFLAAVPGVVQIKPGKTRADKWADQIDFLRYAVRTLTDLPTGTILVRRSECGRVKQARALARGGCPVCHALPYRIETHAKPATLQAGGYRPLQAVDVMVHLHDCVDPVTGIVRQLSVPDVHRLMGGLSKVAIAHHAFPLATPDIMAVIRNRRGRSAGKGRTDIDAKVGAIAEALERYAGVARSGDPTCQARSDDLEGAVITASEWSLYSDRQLTDAALWQALDAPAAWVPTELDPNAEIAWTRVTNLADGTLAWAPSALCWHQFPETSKMPGRADSNGCAAGQTLTDAQLQGLLELVERDAVGIWWWTRARRPEIDLRSLNDPWLSKAAARLAKMGYSVALQDLTHDVGVPVVAAIGWPMGDSGPLLLGFGAHPSARVAASRAMTEIMQVLPDQKAADIGGDPRRGLGLVPGQDQDGASLQDDLGFLRPADTGTDRFGTLPVAPDTADEALAGLTNRLQTLGMRIWTLDQSRPDVPLAVVRMIVPGLRHFRPRFAPGRLFSVPGKMGWATPTRALNRLFIRQ